MASQENKENPLSTSQKEPNMPAKSLEKEEIIPKKKPHNKNKKNTPKQKPKNTNEKTTPTQKPESANKEVTPTQKPESTNKEITLKQEPESANKEVTPTQKPESTNKEITLKQEPESANKEVTPTQKPESTNEEIAPKQKPESTHEEITPTQKPEISNKEITPTQKPEIANKEITPTQEPKSANKEITPTQEPKSANKEITPTQKPEIANKEITPTQKPETTNENPTTDFDDDVDLSEIASNLLDQTFALDDPEFNLPDSSNEAYKSIMSLCSSTTSNIKKSIYEILNSRDKSDGSEEDTTTELQESLNKKMEDFKKVISGCLDNDAAASTSGDVENETVQTGVIIEEVMESCEDQQQADLAKSPDSEGVVEDVPVSDKSPDSEGVVEDVPVSESVDPKDKEDSKSKDGVAPKSKTGKAANDKAKDAGISNLNTDTVANKPDDTAEKVNAKNSKTSEKKPETPNTSSVGSKSLFQAFSEAQIPDNEVLRNLISQDEEKQTKKQKNSATKKKGEKTIDQILKSLGNGTTEEKLHLLCRRHAETLDEYRLVEPRLKQLERQIISQQREKESTQAELNRMILAKSRLEGLCREMQRQSKAVKDESLLRIKEEEEKRKEVANKFQSTLNDISSLMQENSKKNIQLREENAELATKLKGLVDNYELWEQNMSKVVQQKELEAQLAKAKHAKVNLLLKQETEKFLREKQSLLENLSELQKRCTVLTSNELQLRTELSDYTSKYEEFQSVLSNSSKVFSTFKNDMETTSKKIKKLEKETNVYKQKWESSNKALLDMISHKEKQDKDFSTAQQRIICLEKLCRALQAERNELQNQINVYSSSNSVPTTNPEVPSLTTPSEMV